MDARVTEFAVADAKARFSELLARVEAGEKIVIRRHGKAVARLAPIKRMATDEERRRAREEFLSWRKEHGPRLESGVTIKDLINQGRRC